MPNEKIILPDSEEAASIKTVTGWVSRNGHFWGDDERMARYDGSTHKKCEECGKIIPMASYCTNCHARKEIEKYNKMERKEWNEADALYSFSADQYFFSRTDLSDYCENEGVLPDDLLLVICEPSYATTVDPADYYQDELPEDGEVPFAVQEAFDELNAKLEENKTILSWFPGKYAAIIK